MKTKYDVLEVDLASEQAAREAIEKENVIRLQRLEMVYVDAILHTHVELMEDFKEGKHAK